MRHNDKQLLHLSTPWVRCIFLKGVGGGEVTIWDKETSVQNLVLDLFFVLRHVKQQGLYCDE